jgi:holo-ACP synthase
METHHLPVVSMGVVQPGPVKDGPGPRATLQAALGALEALFRERGWPCRSGGVRYLPTGPEALLVVETDAAGLKAALVALEEAHPLGRLWDLDVLDPQAGPITRRHIGLPPRKCLVCGEPAHACARSRAHSLDDLQRAIDACLHAAGLHLV